MQKQHPRHHRKSTCPKKMTLVERLPTFRIGSTNKTKATTTVQEFRAAYGAVPCVIFKNDKIVSGRTGKNKRKKKRKKPSEDTTSAHRHSITGDNYCIDGDNNNNGDPTNNIEDDNYALSFCQILLDTFEAATPTDQESWCVETSNNIETLLQQEETKAKNSKSNDNESDNDNDIDTPKVPQTMTTTTTASEFLAPTSTVHGYCSFLLQDDSEHAITKFTEQHAEFPVLPLSSSLSSSSSSSSLSPPSYRKMNSKDDGDGTTIMKEKLEELNNSIFISQPYWFFVGRNTNSTGEPMPGRAEHTDNIAHDGTFHHQVVGRKVWKLRPTQELRERCDEEYDLALKGHYEVTVEEGDIIVLNTRLWWHQTELPASTTNKTMGTLSISYARDMYLDGNQPKAGDTEVMSSVEGAWAVGFIAMGTVLLTDTDPPIRRSNQLPESNLKMFLLEDNNVDSGVDNSDDDDKVCVSEKGRMKYELVATKDIQEGEWFVIYDESVDENGNEPQQQQQELI